VVPAVVAARPGDLVGVADAGDVYAARARGFDEGLERGGVEDEVTYFVADRRILDGGRRGDGRDGRDGDGGSRA
jgi:hypothetical protein